MKHPWRVVLMFLAVVLIGLAYYFWQARLAAL